MGGYGAMRIAVKYSENFGAVSAISAPLDFDGATGTGGFVEFFEDIINDLDFDIDSTPYDTLRARYQDLDTSYTNPEQTMMFAAATSFSPHDTQYVNPIFFGYDWRDPTGPQLWHSEDTLRNTDSLTYLEPMGSLSPMKYHLPFYFDTTVAGVNEDYTYSPIWDLWLDNNIENIMTDHPGALDTTSILLMTTADASFNFYQQTLDFASHLTSSGIAFDLNTYSGYDGYEATGERFFYDILQDILKYHSDNFEPLD
jgi:S-formylglutathione hydrolase FrmB